jgi:hypothetical protein
MMYATR